MDFVDSQRIFFVRTKPVQIDRPVQQIQQNKKENQQCIGVREDKQR